jgi:hypothetical protein
VSSGIGSEDEFAKHGFGGIHVPRAGIQPAIHHETV